jgi:rRNA maturation protein Rpf1
MFCDARINFIEEEKKEKVYCFLISNPWFQDKFITKYSKNLEIQLSNESRVIHFIETTFDKDFLEFFEYFKRCVNERMEEEELIETMNNFA